MLLFFLQGNIVNAEFTNFYTANFHFLDHYLNFQGKF